MEPTLFTLTFSDTVRLLDADDHTITAAAVVDLPAGEYRWVSDPCILTMDTQLSAWQGKVVFESGGFGYRDLPLTFQAALKSGPGHDGADPVGRIDELFAEGVRVVASGWVTVGDGDDDPGRRYAVALANRNMPGVSVDVAVLRSTDAYVLGNDGMPVDVVCNAHEWQIGGLTAVNMGADPAARVRLELGDAEPEEDGGASDDDDGDDEQMSASAADKYKVFEETFDAVQPVYRTRSTGAGPEELLDVQALTAAGAAPLTPPAEWFDNPNLTRVTPLQVTDDGRVYGHLAPWSQPGKKECHVGFADRCVCAPKSPDGEYPYFLTGEVACADGSRRRCGRVALYGGHHRHDELPWTQVAAMYDDVRNLGALVNVGEDRHGLWAAGCVAPGMTAADIAKLRGSGPSAHWQRVQGDKARGPRLIAAVQVMSQGFPIGSLAASAEGPQVARVEGPTATWDEDGLVSLTAATGTASLVLAKEPADRGTVDVLRAEVDALRATVAEQAAVLEVLAPTVRANARDALG